MSGGKTIYDVHMPVKQLTPLFFLPPPPPLSLPSSFSLPPFSSLPSPPSFLPLAHSRSHSDAQVPTQDTFENVMRVSQMLVQGSWNRHGPLLQLPHLLPDDLRHFRTRRVRRLPCVDSLVMSCPDNSPPSSSATSQPLSSLLQ